MLALAEALPTPPLPVELFGEMRPNFTGRALIKGLLMAGSSCVIFGLPGCGKSFLAADMAFHIASGRRWFDRRTIQGAAVYLAAEGQEGFRLRLEALRQVYGDGDDVLFALVPAAVDLLDPNADLPRVADVLAYVSRKWGGIALLVVDTLAASFGGGDENGSDMAAFVSNVASLCAPYGCARIIVTHAPLIGDAKRPRGHGSLWGAADTVLQITGDRDAPARRIHVIKQKDGDPGPDILFKLRSVEIGTDEDGDTVTSCIVEESGDDITCGPMRRRLSPKEKIGFAALERALVKCGIFPPSIIPDDVLNRTAIGKVATLSEWRSEALSSLANSDTKPDTARRNFDRLRDSLQASDIIGVWEDWAWLKF